jgi:lipopolysaccharide export system protein LptA
MARIGQIISRRDFYFLLPLILSLLPLESAAQEGAVRRRVEILHSDEMQYGRLGDRSRNKLNGNVSLKHNDLTMTCDSALYYDDTNEVYAYSNIHIRQGDTIHIWGNYLFYDGDTGKAVMTDSVKLADKETQLFTRKIDYDTNTQVAVYNEGGRILNGENTLTSITGIYYADRKMLHFRDSVKIVNPDFVMRADTMRYDTYNEIVWFEGPTEAVGDSIYLFCEKGWSDTRKDVSQLMKNAVIDNRQQRITGDTLWYDENKGQGEGFGHHSQGRHPEGTATDRHSRNRSQAAEGLLRLHHLQQGDAGTVRLTFLLIYGLSDQVI